MKGSISSGEYPLLSVDQDISDHLVHTVSRKVTKAIHQVIDVPEFTDYDQVNVCSIDGLFYWVTSFRQSTITNGSISFTLDLMAPTSFLRAGGSVKGSWHKLPMNACPYLRAEIMNDLMIDHAETVIGNVMPDNVSGERKTMFWQICGYDQNNKIRKFCGFMFWDHEGYAGRIQAASTKFYPSFSDIIEGVSTVCPIPSADNVIDFSVSFRCPFEFTRASSGIMKLVSESEEIDAYTYGTNSILACYEITGNYITIHDASTTFTRELPTVSITGSITVDDMTASCGDISIKDWNLNSIFSVPVQLRDSNKRIWYEISTISDITGLFTIIKIGDSQITVPEGHMPFLSNTWETYRAYSLENDREAMENAIRFAEYNKETQTVVGGVNAVINGISTGIMTGFIGGNIAGAGVGIAAGAAGVATSYYEQDRNLELTRMREEADLELTKKRAISQPQSGYNMSYGQTYCYFNEMNPLRIVQRLPARMTSDYFAAWIERYGYPAEGISSQSVTKGYWEGALTNDGTLSGIYFDELNKDFMQGFRFVNPGYDHVIKVYRPFPWTIEDDAPEMGFKASFDYNDTAYMLMSEDLSSILGASFMATATIGLLIQTDGGSNRIIGPMI